jgi:hypothetical protein
VRQLSETEIIKITKSELSDSENLFYRILNEDFTNKTDGQLIGMSSLLSAFINSYTLDSSFFREKLKSIQKVQQLRQEKYS